MQPPKPFILRWSPVEYVSVRVRDGTVFDFESTSTTAVKISHSDRAYMVREETSTGTGCHDFPRENVLRFYAFLKA